MIGWFVGLALAADSGQGGGDWSTRGPLAPAEAGVRLTELAVFDGTSLFASNLEAALPVASFRRAPPSGVGEEGLPRLGRRRLGWGAGMTFEGGLVAGAVAGPQPGFLVPRRLGGTAWGWFDVGTQSHAFGLHYASPIEQGGPWGMWMSDAGFSAGLRYAGRMRWSGFDLAIDAFTGLGSVTVLDGKFGLTGTWKVSERFAAQGAVHAGLSRFAWFVAGARWRATRDPARATVELGGDVMLGVPAYDGDTAPLHAVPVLSVQVTAPPGSAILRGE